MLEIIDTCPFNDEKIGETLHNLELQYKSLAAEEINELDGDKYFTGILQNIKAVKKHFNNYHIDL